MQIRPSGERFGDPGNTLRGQHRASKNVNICKIPVSKVTLEFYAI